MRIIVKFMTKIVQRTRRKEWKQIIIKFLQVKWGKMTEMKKKLPGRTQSNWDSQTVNRNAK